VARSLDMSAGGSITPVVRASTPCMSQRQPVAAPAVVLYKNAMANHAPSPIPAAPLGTVRLLVTAAACDSLMRDAYLRRARALLEPICAEQRYRSAAQERSTVERLLAQSRVAVGRREWDQVEELAGRAAQLRCDLEAQKDALALAEEVYDASPVALDPLSRGLAQLSKVDVAKVRADTLAALERLAAADPDHQAFYTKRRDAMAATAPPEGAARQEAESKDASPERRALAAAERGDAEELRRLAQTMRGSAGRPAGPAVTGGLKRLEVPAVLSQPFPEACVAPARALGLEHVEFTPLSGDLASRIRGFLEQYAWAASPATYDRARDGVAELRHSFDALPALDHATADVWAETVSLFALHLFVNSAGFRYLPLMADREWVLLEAHAEGDDAPSGLCRELGLDRRRALSRDEIEAALLARGADVLAAMKLDPDAYRVVCVPCEVYMRVGRSRGWGAREEWTHFDGYQVRKQGRLLALVGGNARYGGLADLCGISPSDARDNVVARLAVVRRERLGTRLA
jgi:hypothetical protein